MRIFDTILKYSVKTLYFMSAMIGGSAIMRVGFLMSNFGTQSTYEFENNLYFKTVCFIPNLKSIL